MAARHAELLTRRPRTPVRTLAFLVTLLNGAALGLFAATRVPRDWLVPIGELMVAMAALLVVITTATWWLDDLTSQRVIDCLFEDEADGS